MRAAVPEQMAKLPRMSAGGYTELLMHSLSQWIHQRDMLIVGGAVFAAVAILLAWCRFSVRWWVVWAGGLCLSVALAGSLRTPPARTCGRFCKELELPSVAAIDRAVASFGKPVLVEFNSEFGFS